MFRELRPLQKNVAEVLDETEEEDVKAGKSHDLRGPIVFENVDFSYGDGANKILHNLNFKIDQGETVAFLGDTGSGKSSLVSLLPRLYEVDSAASCSMESTSKTYLGMI